MTDEAKQAEHTPGPWEISPTKIGAIVGTGSLMPVTIISSDTAGDEDERPADVAYIPPSSDADADARLIAAAPELLDVLQTIENDAGQVPDWLWDRIQAAIASAKGGA